MTSKLWNRLENFQGLKHVTGRSLRDHLHFTSPRINTSPYQSGFVSLNNILGTIPYQSLGFRCHTHGLQWLQMPIRANEPSRSSTSRAINLTNPFTKRPDLLRMMPSCQVNRLRVNVTHGWRTTRTRPSYFHRTAPMEQKRRKSMSFTVCANPSPAVSWVC